MKSLRRSLNNNGNGNGSSPQPSPDLRYNGSSYSNPTISRPSEKVAPPQKVIKALSSYRSKSPQELSYTKGDFWYVTSEREGWYEALNPLTGSRGLVPKDQFEEFTKGGSRATSGSGSTSTNDQSRSNTPPQSYNAEKTPSRTPPDDVANRRPTQPLYAIVQYDFHAERPDELDARAGEPIVVIAQSNHEWFVAKPIGRLGGPGLIPVTFVEIRDPATGKPLENFPSNIPQVDEWKKATADYKAAAIPLGRFDFTPDQAVTNSPYAPQASGSSSSLPRSTSASSISRAPVAKPPPAIYRPDQDTELPTGQFASLGVPSFHNEQGNYWFRLHATFVPDEPSSPAFTLSLYRQYEDFYEFQINLLDAFPTEAGRCKPGEEDRTPPERIMPYMPGPTDDIVDDELTEYRREELDAYVKALLDLRSRKAEHVLRHELFRTFFAAKYGDYCEELPRQDALEELQEQLADMRFGKGEDERAPSAASNNSQGISPSWNTTQTGSRGPSPLPPIDTRRPDSSGYTASARQSGAGYSATPGTSSSWGSTAPINPITQPPAQNGQPPYVKIKIYDRVTDDLIAIRVHPSVSHNELYEKVRARLGNEINSLRYRTSISPGGGPGGYRELRDDRDLKDWMRAEDQKLVLYAEQV